LRMEREEERARAWPVWVLTWLATLFSGPLLVWLVGMWLGGLGADIALMLWTATVFIASLIAGAELCEENPDTAETMVWCSTLLCIIVDPFAVLDLLTRLHII